MRTFPSTCFLVLAVLATVSHSAAAELHLRAQCVPAGPVVTLGDIAEIDGAGPAQVAALAAVELFPAPAAGEEKTVGVRELQDLLLLHGVNLAEHRFSGASEVAVRVTAARQRIAPLKPILAAEMQRIERRIREALLKYLNEQSVSPQDWAIEFELPDAKARLFADPLLPVQIAGGSPPWTGRQQFELSVNGPKGSSQTALDVSVRLIPPVVVAVRSLARGAVIREGDVELRRLPAADKLPGALHSLDDAINHELVRAVGADSAVASESLRPPLAVHRGDVVTVTARAGGVRIRTNARARDEGCVGELVAVESLLNRSLYYARVVGNREVEVYARPPQVENETADDAVGMMQR